MSALPKSRQKMYTSLVDTKGVYMKEDLWLSIRSDRLKGLSYVSMTKKYSLDRRTVKSIVYLKQNQNIIQKIKEKEKLINTKNIFLL